jgi:transposase
MCHVVKGKWCGTAAAKMYSNSLAPALRKAYPHQRKFKVLEDNDPTGYKSKAGEVAKKNAKIEVFELPKRSPDLNPLDYGFWSAVNRRLRLQEARFPKTKCETRKQFISRLRRVVLRIPKAVLTPMVRSMKWRCIAVKKAKGGHFEESPKKAKGCRK